MPLSPALAADLAPLAAQCAGGQECDLPRSLPWYLGLAGVLVWGVLMFGVVTVARHRRRLRTERRRDEGRGRKREQPGGDLEPF